MQKRKPGNSSLAASVGLGTTALTTEPPTQPIPKRPLGKTGHKVTIYGLGGLFTVARHDRHDDAVEIVNRAIDLGVNTADGRCQISDGSVFSALWE